MNNTNTYTQSPSQRTAQSPAIEELCGIFAGWRIWLTLAWNDIKLRYRRSTLGPFWITASMAVRIYFMGFLYSHLFKVDIVQYFPFLASGIITWVTISTLITESATTFIVSETYLRNMKILYSHLVMYIIVRSLIVFAHNFLAYIPIIAYYGPLDPNFNSLNFLLLIPNSFILIFNIYLWSTILAILGTRFRDMASIIESLVQVAFFVTPIMWMPSLLPEKYQWAAFYNPLYHLVSLIREPLLGHSVTSLSYIIMGLVTLSGFTCFYYLMNKTKHRIIFWL